MRAGRLSEPPTNFGLLNRAVLWQLEWAMRLCDRLGYSLAALRISQAIDAIVDTAISDQELRGKDFGKEERARLLLELYAQHEAKGEDPDTSAETEAD
jgi:hypothetical protein